MDLKKLSVRSQKEPRGRSLQVPQPHNALWRQLHTHDPIAGLQERLCDSDPGHEFLHPTDEKSVKYWILLTMFVTISIYILHQ